MSTNLRDRAMNVLIAWGGGGGSTWGTNRRDRALRAVLNGLGLPTERGPGLSDEAYLAIIEHLGATGLTELNLQNRAWEAVLQMIGSPGTDQSTWDRAYQAIIDNGGLTTSTVSYLTDPAGNHITDPAGNKIVVRA